MARHYPVRDVSMELAGCRLERMMMKWAPYIAEIQVEIFTCSRTKDRAAARMDRLVGTVCLSRAGRSMRPLHILGEGGKEVIYCVRGAG